MCLGMVREQDYISTGWKGTSLVVPKIIRPRKYSDLIVQPQIFPVEVKKKKNLHTEK